MPTFDPTKLEPKNGDFARYIEELNRGAIEQLKAVQVTEADMARASDHLQDDLMKATQKVEAARAMDPVAQRREVLKEKSKVQGRQQLAKALTPLCIFSGFGCFALGGILGEESIIFTGMGIFVFGMFSTAILGRKRK